MPIGKIKKVIVSSAYFGSIDHWIAISLADELIIEAEEHFVKQSFRNRTYIYAPNGKQKLVVSLKKVSEHIGIKEIEIAFKEGWVINHLRSIEAAYNNSPFFEFYRDELKLLFEKPEKMLFKNNIKLMKWVAEKIGIAFNPVFADSYSKNYENCLDLREKIHPKKPTIFQQSPYLQTFQERFGFLENLSVLDLIFNLGPQSFAYLAEQKMKDC